MDGEKAMYTIAFSCVLLAFILSKYFKCYVLIPVSSLVAVGVLSAENIVGRDTFGQAQDIALLLVCLQLGYMVGMLAAAFRSGAARSKTALFRLKAK